MKSKRILSIILSLCMVLALLPAGTVTVFAGGGTGTAADPILIGTAAELNAFAERVNAGEYSLCAKLTADIVLNDETFAFDPDTGLVAANDGSHAIVYLGTGIKGDASGANSAFDATASKSNKCYSLKNSTYTEITYTSNITMWTPMGRSTSLSGTITSNPYTGTFDGGGHTIGGLFINSRDTDVGLFGSSGGTIKNVGIINSYIGGYGTGSVGGICGKNNNAGVISGCYVKGVVISDYDIGGICGYNSTGSISDCYTEGTVIGARNIGGIAGYNGSGIIKNCYTIGTQKNFVTLTGTKVGCICGINQVTGSDITNCYYLANGGLSGIGVTQNGATSSKVSVKTAAQFASGEVTYLLNGSRSEGTTENPLAWYQTCGTGYPAFSGETVYYTYADCTATVKSYANRLHPEPGHSYDDDDGFCVYCDEGYKPAVQISSSNYTEFGFTVDNWSVYENYYAIANAGNLYWFAAQVNDGNTTYNAVLTTDIVLNPGTFDTNGTYAPADGETARQWTAIGSYDSPFTGTFDGNGHTVSGIYVNTASNLVGLFGKSAGTIKNTGVINSYIRGVISVGGICGSNVSGDITNCYNTGTVSASNYYVGGVCGSNGGSVTGCYNTGAVSGSDSVGGVIGSNNGTVTNCYYLDTSCTGGNSVGTP
ncbi:MAG: hypothetical protein GX051_00250, partial [Clostridiales bacterium]|nr:hypothetical protein [Clostridiales bacterium]